MHSTHSTFTYMRCTAQVEARLNLEEGEDAFGALSLGEDVYGPFSGQVRSVHLAAIATKCSSGLHPSPALHIDYSLLFSEAPVNAVSDQRSHTFGLNQTCWGLSQRLALYL